MKNNLTFFTRIIFLLFLACILFACTSPEARFSKVDTLPSGDAQQYLTSHLHSPISFIENKGQLGIDHPAQFYLKAGSAQAYFSPQGISYVFSVPTQPDSLESSSFKVQRLDMVLQGSNPQVNIQGKHAYSDTYHFYNQHVPQGLNQVQHFEELWYKDLYPHIDLKLYVAQGAMKYDFIVHPGGKVEDIKLSYKGQDSLSLDTRGQLQVRNSLGMLQDGTPYSYQQIAGEMQEIPSKFRLDKNHISFDLAPYDSTQILVIDPEVVWATYYGYNGLGGEEIHESANDICTDSEGNIYVVGEVRGYASGFATNQDQGFQDYATTEYSGDMDAFIVKFTYDGNRIWAAYYGGGEEDEGLSVCVDPFDNVVMSGFTQSASGIAYNGHDNTYNEYGVDGNRFDRDAFLVKFDSDGERSWGSYYGGEDALAADTRAEEGWGVEADYLGNIYMVGFTSSTTGIATEGAHDTAIGNYDYDAFLVKFNSIGTRMWGTYFGGSEEDMGYDLCVSPQGDVYITGQTSSNGLGQGGWDNSYHEDIDAFLAKFDALGNLYWSTYYGYWGLDIGHSLATNGTYVYLAGVTTSSYGIADGGPDETYNGGRDAFLVKFNFFGTPVWSTYFGGEGDEGESTNALGQPYYFPTVDVALSNLEEIYVAGNTVSNNGIGTSGSINPTRAGSWDGYLVKYHPDGSLQWSTYYGGENYDAIRGVTTSASSHILIAGETYSPSNIAVSGSQNTYAGAGDVFVARIYPYGDTPDGPDGYEIEDDDPIFGEIDEFKLILSPNPTFGKVEVSFPNEKDGPYRIQILDKRGNEVYLSKALAAPLKETLNLSKLKTGVYTVVLHGHKTKQTAELQVQ
ncbi:MAG: T9SS type A sorting domain-containing protein [Bacteroidota bacterium]